MPRKLTLVHPPDASLASILKFAPAPEPRRLTIRELERYIRKGCCCTLCEFVQEEIRARGNAQSMD